MSAAGWYDDVYDPSRWRWWDGRQWTDHYAPKFTSPAAPHQPQIPEKHIATTPLELPVSYRLPASQWVTAKLQQGFLTLDPTSGQVRVLDANRNVVVSFDARNALFGWAGYQFRIMDKTAPKDQIVQIDFRRNERPAFEVVSQYSNHFFMRGELNRQKSQKGYKEFVDTLEHLGGRWSRDVYRKHAWQIC